MFEYRTETDTGCKWCQLQIHCVHQQPHYTILLPSHLWGQVECLPFSTGGTASTWKQRTVVPVVPTKKVWRKLGSRWEFCRKNCGTPHGSIPSVILYDITLLEEAQCKVSFHMFRLVQLKVRNWLRTSWGKGGGLFPKHWFSMDFHLCFLMCFLCTLDSHQSFTPGQSLECCHSIKCELN